MAARGAHIPEVAGSTPAAAIVARYLWKQCWHWWPPTCAARFWRLARTAWICERAGRKYERIFDESTQKRGYVFDCNEWWFTVTVNGMEFPVTRACPREGWADICMVRIVDGSPRIACGPDGPLVARLHGDVAVTNAIRHGGISDLAPVDG